MIPVLVNMGLVLQLAGILIAFPIAMAFTYNETQAIISLFLTSFAFFFVGFFLNTLSVRRELDFRQSCILLTTVFFILGIIGAIPYFWLNAFNDTSILSRFMNSLFESVSGYTTTGFSLITDPDALPRSLMFYRSFTHLVGGLGVVFMLLAFFYTGSTLENMSKVMNFVRVTDSIKRSLVMILVVYTVYILLFSTVFYLLGFTMIADSISVVISSLMTGGFSPATDFSPYAGFPTGLLVIVMMIFGATSFFIHYRIISRKSGNVLTKEFWMFLLVSASGVLALMIVYPIDFFITVFHVISASTGTGFSSMPFNNIPEKGKLVFIFLMFFGGMSFSTAGGIKIMRVALFLKSIPMVIGNSLGKGTEKIEFDEIYYDRNEIVTNLVIILLSIVLVVATTVLISFSGFSLIDSMFEAVSAFGTTGLSVGIATTALAMHLKLMLIFLMVIGRVEILPFLVALSKLGTYHFPDHNEVLVKTGLKF
ncbi:MAG TPA: potassium transporter TrkG [candidate division Zixibacteria bacterium]|nr:potassium transporter TrkG [candidate division Zixibacteria bacterium]